MEQDLIRERYDLSMARIVLTERWYRKTTGIILEK